MLLEKFSQHIKDMLFLQVLYTQKFKLDFFLILFLL